ncbi:protein phosphatase 2C domain-containing protein [Synechocystis sp. PCC 7509]|uniref:protein phosphatase 2C domain-containing protein n=1 Tax=Synechocystis sp. PCC 7509 TaxID=927677 RepID=UPI0002ACB23A|nr:protein phosphatase 2C domain-containing protein [Synechocystis sp. PCC 7509]
MQNDVAITIQCSNEACKATNNDTDKYCQQCGTPINKRYLWAVGAGSDYKVGDMAQSRYLLLGDRIFLDTLPSNPPDSRSTDISHDIKPYLRLVSYRLQIPQVYAWLLPQEPEKTKILLLENAAIYSDAERAGQLMPQLSAVWQDATSLRQLHWLWQIAGLWQPLSSEGVASSLLNSQLIRVEQSIVHLLQLQLVDGETKSPTLSQLGELWHQLIPEAKPAISEYLERVCYGLITGEISHPDDLITSLEKAIAECGRSLSYKITNSTLTDQGPSRQRNEDACFPASGTTKTNEKAAPIVSTLTIVCDGIGGHEGGNVASNLAIETIVQQAEQLSLAPTSDDHPLIGALEQATHVANDRISDRNDSEYRTGRQRMGTTLVMAVAYQQQMYITHVGDSRAYLITRTGCHQVTLDDDVAAREVRLGYSLYSTAVLAPSSGSLIQALGMNLALHPTVNRFILDEDCVFLLCSDGLSDYDRVEQYWDTEILPILEGKFQVTNVTARLIEIANTRNGHDNVTVGIIHYQSNFVEPSDHLSPSLALVDSNPVQEEAITEETPETPEPIVEPATIPTEILAIAPKKSASTKIILGLTLLLGLGGLAYLFMKPVYNLFKPEVRSNPLTTKTDKISPTETALEIDLKSVFQIKTSTAVTVDQVNNLPLRQEPETTASNALVGAISPGNIVQVADRKITLDRQKWLLLKVCASTTQVDDLSGWIPETELVAVIEKAPANTCFVSSNTQQSPANNSSVELPN